MSIFTHSYFGSLRSDAVDFYDVLWEGVVRVKQDSAGIWLKCKPGTVLDAERLDSFAALLKGISKVDACARDRLRCYLMEDPDYMEYHIQEMPEAPSLAALIKSAPDSGVSASDFVGAMQLRRIYLYHDAEAVPVMLDYSIDDSDQVLAVEMHLSGVVADLKWES